MKAKLEPIRCSEKDCWKLPEVLLIVQGSPESNWTAPYCRQHGEAKRKAINTDLRKPRVI
jgi:hypothetical protein